MKLWLDQQANKSPVNSPNVDMSDLYAPVRPSITLCVNYAKYSVQILPHLDKHISAEASVAGGDGTGTEKAKRRSTSAKATTSASAAAKPSGSGNEGGEDARRKDLRKRIIRFLGRLGGRCGLCMQYYFATAILLFCRFCVCRSTVSAVAVLFGAPLVWQKQSASPPSAVPLTGLVSFCSREYDRGHLIHVEYNRFPYEFGNTVSFLPGRWSCWFSSTPFDDSFALCLPGVGMWCFRLRPPVDFSLPARKAKSPKRTTIRAEPLTVCDRARVLLLISQPRINPDFHHEAIDHVTPRLLSLAPKRQITSRSHMVAVDASQALSESLAWETEETIILDVPYNNQSEALPLCLDGVLQRLVELAMHDGTRQTKTLAAECLHALVVFMVSVGCV